ncbi:hypothetical protein, partial [Pseudochrobactrum asaccharolyticum]|uniref:hypothetical protein n=1 Tax=Pseudochrobactrum asaccharolyticum TaxID=354351 RepID=UPI0035BBB13B
ETLQRRWYFVLRHGRVGRCQVCKGHINKQNIFSNHNNALKTQINRLAKTIFKNISDRIFRVERPFGLKSIINRFLYGLTSSGYA